MRQTLEMMGRIPDAAMPHEVALELCQRLGVEAMLEGSVSAVGRLTIVALVASDCGTGEIIVRDQVEVERKEDVLREVGRLASTMRTSLGESMASLQSYDVPIEEGTTPSLEALKAYTAGVMQRAAGHEIDSIHAFERAIELDPEFALAYTTLSSVYGGLGETRRGEEFARRAYEHRDSISERERLFVTYQFHDRVTGDQLKARETLEVWKQSFPRDYRPANALAVLLNRLGDYDRAILEAQDAIKRNPAHSFPYSNLAYAYRGAGQFDKARETAATAVSRGIATLPTRRLLYQMAEMEGHAAAADEHFAWAQTRARAFDLVGARAQVAAYRGRMRDSRDLYKQTIDLASTTGFALIGTGYAAQAALTEAMYGYSGPAIAQATSLASSEEYAPALRAATALALAGSTAAAELVVRRFRNERPQDTILHAVYLPVAEAALLLSRDRPAQAIEALRRAAPYERGTVAALLPMYLRGEAYRRIGSHSNAAREFGAVLQNRGAEPFSPVLPLAHRGLVRALALAGDEPGSRRAFDALRSIWREPDADLPVGIGMVNGTW
jgi:tetratricopeptide (TPR) repeat protein